MKVPCEQSSMKSAVLRPCFLNAVRRLKSMDAEPRISWRIVHRAPSFKPEWNRCPLCLAEKYEIINFKDRDKLLNKRSEVMAKCRHRTKYSLDSQI